MLPSVVAMYDKLDMDGYREKIAKEIKGKEKPNEKILGIGLLKFVLANSAKVKTEIFEIVAVFEDKTVEEVKTQSFMKTINSVRTIFEDKDTTDFLKQAMQ